MQPSLESIINQAVSRASNARYDYAYRRLDLYACACPRLESRAPSQRLKAEYEDND